MTKTAPVSRAALLLGITLMASACASYEPPLPGKYRAPGEKVAEAVCGYETPTATRFMQMRCRSAEEVNRIAAEARDSTDSIRPPPPEQR